MKKDQTYANGQPIWTQSGAIHTTYFKTGIIRAKGRKVGELMDGKWIFNRESGQLWQVGNFNKGKREGSWVRYDKNGKQEYLAYFRDDKQVSEFAWKGGFPVGMSGPSERALANAGITKLDQLAKHTEAAIADLHGMGPKVLVILKKALKAKGKSLKK